MMLKNKLGSHVATDRNSLNQSFKMNDTAKGGGIILPNQEFIKKKGNPSVT
jgi:hypothetical protein